MTTVRQTAEVTVNDLSDAYSVTLTNEAASFKATATDKLGTATTATTKPQAFRGTEAVACTVTKADCVCSDSTNVSVSDVNNSGDNATWPLLTISIGANAANSGTVTIPVVIGTGANAVTINKVFSYSIALKGTGGTAAYNYFLDVSPDAVVRAENGTLSPSSITLSSTRLQGTGNPSAYSGRFKVEKYVNGAWASTAVYTSSANESSKSVNVPTDSGLTLLRCSLYLAGGTSTLLDQRTVPVVSDGPTGATGQTGGTGAAGADAYTVVLSSEAHAFPADKDGKCTTTTGVKVDVIAYKGASRIAATIGTITGTTTGKITAPITSNGTTSAYFTVTPTLTLDIVSGELTVPLTVDGKSFTKKFSWALSAKGLTGAKGDTGPGGISMSITSNNGITFRNNSGITTLTAHVYQDGAELTGTALSALGTITWYKDGTATGTTGATQSVSASDVATKAVYTAKLEG